MIFSDIQKLNVLKCFNAQKMSRKIILTIITFLFISICYINSQTIKELEAQKKQAQEKLEATQKLLNEAKKSKKGTESELHLLAGSIQETSTLIFTINSEIDGLNRDINNLQIEKNNLAKQLERTKQEYATMISRNEIFRKQFSPVLFIFSAKNFTQGLRRARYLLEIADYKKKQILEIKTLTQNIVEKETTLQNYVTKKSQSLHQKEQENQKLNQKKEQQNKLLKTYNKKMQEYSATIVQEQQKQKNLDNLIRAKVAEENRKKAEMARRADAAKNDAGKTSATKGKTAAPKTEKPILTEQEFKQYKEDQQLTGSFAKNKGNLPMPVESGKIYRHFGRQINPNTNAVENNSGIYILSPTGTDARAVFDGTVFEVMYEPGSGHVIWIMHGTYATVYAQLSLYYVKAGDKVSARQKIGKIAQKNDKTEMNFYILNQNANYENPEIWLAH